MLSLTTGFREKGKHVISGRWLLLGGIGLAFWAGIFLVSLRVLTYFESVEAIGDVLSYKLLSMLLITLFSLLIFSSILTSLSKLYLSRDLLLVHSLPVPSFAVFTARWMESTADSSWMVVIYTLPVFIAFGVASQAGGFFYLAVALAVVFLSMLASAASAIVVMAASLIVPAGRMRSVFLFLGLLLFLLLFLAFRLLRPERLVNPEVFTTTLQYIQSLRTPSSPLIPTTWAFDALRAVADRSLAAAGFHLALLASGACMLTVAAIAVSEKIYFKGLSRSHTAALRQTRHGKRNLRRFRGTESPAGAFARKEISTFFRDQTQWSQLFLIAGLVVIYVYNFSVLPLEKAPIQTIYLQNLLSFLNMGLAAFVLTAVTARFAFPAVSLEKEAFWLVQSSPISLRTFLWVKFGIYFFPLLLLTEILVVATNLMLRVTPFMMALSTLTLLFVVPGVVSMGVGLGAAYPNFKSENPAQAVTSYGGFLFMALSGVYIAVVIILEAGPVYRLFMAGLRGQELSVLEWGWIAGSFGVAGVLSVAAVVFPMRFGEKRLSVVMG